VTETLLEKELRNLQLTTEDYLLKSSIMDLILRQPGSGFAQSIIVNLEGIDSDREFKLMF